MSAKGNKQKWTIIGGGNGGQSMAGHLAIMGFPVKLYDIFPETIEAIRKQGGIKVEGAVEGFGKLELATTDISQALEGADIVIVVAPALAHKAIAKDCAPLLKDDQVIVLHPGSTFGVLEFKQTLVENDCYADLVIAEAESLLYACRSKKPGHANILGVKECLKVAAFPAKENERVLKMLNTAFPQMYAGANVLEVSLSNLNAMMHPGPTLLNTSLIESIHEWLYYWDGITPSIGEFVEQMDKERLAVAEALGIKLKSVGEMYKILYGVEGESLSEAVKKNKAYEGVKGQKNIRTRYVLEDIPMGLVPMVSLGKMLGIDVSRMETIVKLGEFLLDKDFTKEGRTVDKIGLIDMTPEEVINYVETGIRGQRALA
ncbi:NAD/NADP-dependent octopine/nopaline dehydrogenase family protein [Maledivibacter halophilus]|uniref:Opine dehydrogenase n=1 Tax=Maledivibacter halophilus TaxID=36842 RepID=A0A1T5JJK8_9FIRM|nr:NAD/NADP-dependent octopine/nopaline dehydrogenase family protein [Maledivibacter halophilus]SKC51408.1 opine dehydrogenase [Maledivibacter halophilus]